MTLLFAHHLEPHHVGIAVVLFVVGTIAGWSGCGRWLVSSTEGRPSS